MDPSQSDILTRRHQVTAAIILAICLGLMAVSWLTEYYDQQRRINIDRPFEARSAKLRICINSADWPELTLLPDISETMARRIVEHREAQGDFQSIVDIQHVQGIGPRTFARIEPYLSLSSAVASTAQED
jgi:competence ComEA-like helix-hairpin-helix protein